MPSNIITAVYRDDLTGLPVVEDLGGALHVLSKWEDVIPPSVHNRVYIQTVSHGQFPGINDFYPIPNELTGEPNTIYATPPGQRLNIFFIMASQDKLPGGHKAPGPEMSMIGVFINDIFIMLLPFRYDLHYVLAETLRFPPIAKIEIKLRPCDVRTRVAILAGGFLTESVG